MLHSPSNGFTKPELFQSNSASGTISVKTFVGCRIIAFGSDTGLELELCDDNDDDGLVGSIGLKLMLAANRGMFDEADDKDDIH